MARKRYKKSPDKNQVCPSTNSMDRIPVPLNEPTPATQPEDHQKLGEQFIQLVGSAVNIHLERNPPKFITLPNDSQTHLIRPDIIITNATQALNFKNDISYPVFKPIGCRNSTLMKEIHEAFKNNVFVNTAFENFEPRFIGGISFARRMIWLRGINLLTYTFKYIMDNDIIPFHDEPNKVIAEHFCDEDGNDFKNEQLQKNSPGKLNDPDKKELVRRAFFKIIKKIGEE